jgi:hypothetical protein
MHSIEELLKASDFHRSDRLSAAILNYTGNDSQANRESLDQLIKALQFLIAITSPSAAPLLKLAFDGIENLLRNDASEDERPYRWHKRRYRTVGRIGPQHISLSGTRSSMRI